MPINMQPLGENTANIPAFLGKLWKMVNDPATDHLISWSPAGNSFIIQNQAQFWYELLPLYYKHNNMSSFVRQLNMYGFHKMSTVENGTMDADKDENQFYHPYFQKDQPELLVNIKRKVTASKSAENNVQNMLKHDDIAKVLMDVKQLRGRQSSVDSQLSAMKQENAVLWRELAMLRQKHNKQQQIVNKLIQFLVTLVQPSTASRMGVGVKRRMPLMLHESPIKKAKSKKPVRSELVDGPTIHELDTEIEISPEELLEQEQQEVEDQPEVASPVTNPSVSPQPASDGGKYQSDSVSSPGEVPSETVVTDNFWDKPEFVEISQLQPDELIMSDNELTEENLNDLQSDSGQSSQTNEKIFLNPTARDTLLSNLVNGSYNTNVLNGKNTKKCNSNTTGNTSTLINTNEGNSSDMTVATRDYKIANGDDLDLHLDHTQSEIDQLKDILHGCNTLDANTLLGLFNDDQPTYGLSINQNKDDLNLSTDTLGSQLISADPMVSGTELATCGNNLIDFNELFDDSIDGQDNSTVNTLDTSSTVNTPLIVKSEPLFPTFDKEM